MQELLRQVSRSVARTQESTHRLSHMQSTKTGQTFKKAVQANGRN